MIRAIETGTRLRRSALVVGLFAALVLAPQIGSAADKNPPKTPPKPAPKPAPKAAPAPVCDGNGPMWWSILHPGLGEMKLADKGWAGVPKKKFWLGFIPFFGWPGYLQVVSAIDAKHCKTHDWPK